MASPSRLMGGSMASNAIVCSIWLCTMSPMIPPPSKNLHGRNWILVDDPVTIIQDNGKSKTSELPGNLFVWTPSSSDKMTCNIFLICSVSIECERIRICFIEMCTCTLFMKVRLHSGWKTKLANLKTVRFSIRSFPRRWSILKHDSLKSIYKLKSKTT